MVFTVKNAEFWLWLGGGVIGLAAVVPVLIRHRKRQSRARLREAHELPQWIKRFGSTDPRDSPLIEEIVRTYAELYGVAPGQIRPEDVLVENYGGVSSLVLDDTYVTFMDTLQRRIRARFGVEWQPSAMHPTLGALIRGILGEIEPRSSQNERD